MEGSPPCGGPAAAGAPGAPDEDAVAASDEDEERFLERAAMEGMAVHLWESKTIRKVSTAVPTA